MKQWALFFWIMTCGFTGSRLARCMELDVKDTSKRLFKAFSHSNHEKVVKILDNVLSSKNEDIKHQIIHAFDELTGFQPIHRAAAQGHMGVLTRLLDYGVDHASLTTLNVPQLPIELALIHQQPEIFTFLFDNYGSNYDVARLAQLARNCYADTTADYLESLQSTRDETANWIFGENERGWLDSESDTHSEAYQEDENVTIRKLETYVPRQFSPDARPIIWLLIHGTWGRETKEFFDGDDDIYQGIKQSAARHAKCKNAPLKLVSFVWRAKQTKSSRGEAAWRIKAIFTDMGWHKTQKVIISHSHGCNIANKVTRLMPIDLLIHLACPRRPEDEYQPVHFGQLIYFWSNGDWTSLAANTDHTVLSGLLYVAPLFRQVGKNIATAPKKIKEKIQQLFECGVSEESPTYSFRPIDQYTHTLHRLSEQDTNDGNDRIIVGVRTKINGKHPGHSDIKKILIALPKIIKKLQQNNHEDYSTGSDFQLVLELSGEEVRQCRIAVLQPGTRTAPESFDLFFSKSA